MKVYHLSTCSTNKRILKELDLQGSTNLQDIKKENITPEQLDEIKELAGSYEALFSRKAMKFRAQGLHEKTLSEQNYRDLILEEYTFLKRPIIVLGNQIFVGNSKKNVAAAKQALISE